MAPARLEVANADQNVQFVMNQKGGRELLAKQVVALPNGQGIVAADVASWLNTPSNTYSAAALARA